MRANARSQSPKSPESSSERDWSISKSNSKPAIHYPAWTDGPPNNHVWRKVVRNAVPGVTARQLVDAALL